MKIPEPDHLADEVDESVLRLLGGRTLADALLELRALDAERVHLPPDHHIFKQLDTWRKRTRK